MNIICTFSDSVLWRGVVELKASQPTKCLLRHSLGNALLLAQGCSPSLGVDKSRGVATTMGIILPGVWLSLGVDTPRGEATIAGITLRGIVQV
jgi:hypothetical protein